MMRAKDTCDHVWVQSRVCVCMGPTIDGYAGAICNLCCLRRLFFLASLAAVVMLTHFFLLLQFELRLWVFHSNRESTQIFSNYSYITRRYECNGDGQLRNRANTVRYVTGHFWTFLSEFHKIDHVSLECQEWKMLERMNQTDLWSLNYGAAVMMMMNVSARASPY